MIHHRRGPPRGFTLIEAAIVLAIAAVLLGAAVPDLSRTIAARGLAVQAGQFMATLRFARSEAMKRGEPVTVCAAEPTASGPRCQAGAATDWRSGWIVFVDRAGRGRMDPGEAILRLQQPLARTGGVAGTRATLTYTPGGFTTDAASHYLFQPPDGAGPAASTVVLVCVSRQGRPRQAPGGVCE